MSDGHASSIKSPGEGLGGGGVVSPPGAFSIQSGGREGLPSARPLPGPAEVRPREPMLERSFGTVLQGGVHGRVLRGEICISRNVLEWWSGAGAMVMVFISFSKVSILPRPKVRSPGFCPLVQCQGAGVWILGTGLGRGGCPHLPHGLCSPLSS